MVFFYVEADLSESNNKKWHIKLGYLNQFDLKLACKKNMLSGFSFDQNEKLDNWEVFKIIIIKKGRIFFSCS
jgi:hypothetical protein